MKVLISIKPEYANKIFEGSKKYEFRKVIFKNPDIKTVIVYSSSPVQQVIGEFEIDEIISCNPENIWRITKSYSGVSKDFFNEYFYNREVAHAIKIKKVKKYKKPLCIRQDLKALPPQSFCYI